VLVKGMEQLGLSLQMVLEWALELVQVQVQ
jgi:hypothetical protein